MKIYDPHQMLWNRQSWLPLHPSPSFPLPCARGRVLAAGQALLKQGWLEEKRRRGEGGRREGGGSSGESGEKEEEKSERD